MKSEALSLKAIINGLIFYGKQLLFNKTLEEKKKRFVVAFKQINRKNNLIFVMLQNTMNYLLERKTENQ